MVSCGYLSFKEMFKKRVSFFSELYLRWIVDQKNNENTLIQIQELVTNEKELRTKVGIFLKKV